MIGDLIHGMQVVVVLLFGALTSWTDSRYGKIDNAHVLFLGMGGVLLSFVEAFMHQRVLWWGAAILLSVVIPVGMWLKNWIPAGDAKLLIAFSSALPSWWYPKFAPGLYPFSLVLVISLGLLAVPVVCKAVINGGLGKTRTNAFLLRSCAASVFVSVMILFVVMVWQSHSGSNLSVWGIGSGVILVSGAWALSYVNMEKIPVWLILGGTCAAGIAFLRIGGSPLWLAAALPSAVLFALVNGWLLPRVVEVSTHKVHAGDLQGGEVVNGIDYPEGVSFQMIEELKLKAPVVWILEEVRLAHMVFAVTMAVGAVHGVGWLLRI